MEELILQFFGSRITLTMATALGAFLMCIFVYLFFRRNGRDERGRGIFAFACFIAMCVYAFLINVLSGLPREMFTNSLMSRNLLVWTFDTVFIIQIVVAVILDKFK